MGIYQVCFEGESALAKSSPLALWSRRYVAESPHGGTVSQGNGAVSQPYLWIEGADLSGEGPGPTGTNVGCCTFDRT